MCMTQESTGASHDSAKYEMHVLRQMVEKRLELGTGQYGSGVRRPGERHSTQRGGDGDATVDGSIRSRSEDG